MSLLIVFAGLPATGKTTLARELARRLAATHLRIDTIEQSLKAAGLAVGPTGYEIANALAADNLMLGRPVIADCVNPVLASRNGWRETAFRCSARLVEAEISGAARAKVVRRTQQRDAQAVPKFRDNRIDRLAGAVVHHDHVVRSCRKRLTSE